MTTPAAGRLPRRLAVGLPALAGPARRVASLVGVLVAVSILTFLLLSLLPGDPALAILGPTNATAANVAAVHKELHLDQPLPVQYLHWVANALHGNLGYSYQNGQTVASEIGQTLPVTLELTVLAMVLSLALAVPLAMLSARRPGKAADRVITGLTLGALSLPSFIVAVVMILGFAVQANALPATGWVPLSQNPLENLRSAALPSVSLAIGVTALFARVLRSDMMTNLQEDFVSFSRVKGLSSSRIMAVHVLRPSSLSLLTLVGVEFGVLLSGAVLIEQIFALPGMGRLLVQAILSRDLATVQGVVLVITAGFVIINFLVDAGYRLLDPRIRRSVDG